MGRPAPGLECLKSSNRHVLRNAVLWLRPAPTGAAPSLGHVPLDAYPVGSAPNVWLVTTVTVLAWDAAKGSFTPIQTVSFSPRAKGDDGRPFSNTACDAVLTRDGKFAYFANRGDDFIVGFHIAADGKLTEFPSQSKIWSGGTTPRNFTLDPTERWMLVANQNSSNLTVYPRDPKTGILASHGKNTPAATPMCIVFV